MEESVVASQVYQHAKAQCDMRCEHVLLLRVHTVQMMTQVSKPCSFVTLRFLSALPASFCGL
jgi:hypothetical protein